MKRKFLVGIGLILASGLFYEKAEADPSMGIPDTVKVSLPKPHNKIEALERIPDYVILDLILPPPINRKKLKYELFGNYTQAVESYLAEKGVSYYQLKLIVAKEFKKPNFTVENIKKKILKAIGFNEYLQAIKITTLIVALVAILGGIAGIFAALVGHLLEED